MVIEIKIGSLRSHFRVNEFHWSFVAGLNSHIQVMQNCVHKVVLFKILFRLSAHCFWMTAISKGLLQMLNGYY